MDYKVTQFQKELDESKYTFNKEIGNIPNKPLHLYTEQEEKNLYELLLKLKDND